jgi:citrate lyase subunit beta/citryl-CoA lyase
MLERAKDFPADIVMVDLEDSVPPEEKVNARDMAIEWVPKLRAAGRRVMVRVNSLDTGLTRDELSAVVSPDLAGISLGKVESPKDVRDVDRMLLFLERAAGLEPGQVKIIPWIENARAMVDAYQIATSSTRIVGVAFGAEDYTGDMGIERTDNGEEIYFPRATVAVAARAARVAALDSPYVLFRNPDGLREDAGHARKLGFTGKFAIHPAQIDIINEAFSPSEEELAYARKVVEVWNKAEAQGRGSANLDGRMIDVPVIKRAQNLLSLAESISDKLTADR